MSLTQSAGIDPVNWFRPKSNKNIFRKFQFNGMEPTKELLYKFTHCKGRTAAAEVLGEPKFCGKGPVKRLSFKNKYFKFDNCAKPALDRVPCNWLSCRNKYSKLVKLVYSTSGIVPVNSFVPKSNLVSDDKYCSVVGIVPCKRSSAHIKSVTNPSGNESVVLVLQTIPIQTQWSVPGLTRIAICVDVDACFNMEFKTIKMYRWKTWPSANVALAKYVSDDIMYSYDCA